MKEVNSMIPTSSVFTIPTGLADVDSEFEQFTVDAGRSPKWIFATYSADQLSHLLRDCRSAMPAVTNLPSPK
jgi:hypothetical protein